METVKNLKLFTDEYQEIYAAYCFSIQGMNDAAKTFKKSRPNKGSSTQRLFIGEGAPGEADYIAVVNVNNIIERSKKFGDFEDIISKQTFFYIYTIWDVKYRKLMAKELNTETRNIKCDILGDVRLLRNEIAHKNATLSKEIHGSLLVLQDLFRPGQLILDRTFMSKFIKLLNDAEFRIECNDQNHLPIQ